MKTIVEASVVKVTRRGQTTIPMKSGNSAESKKATNYS